MRHSFLVQLLVRYYSLLFRSFVVLEETSHPPFFPCLFNVITLSTSLNFHLCTLGQLPVKQPGGIFLLVSIMVPLCFLSPFPPTQECGKPLLEGNII